MTLSQIIQTAMRRLDEDLSDVQEFRDLFVAYANEAYQIATNEFYKPREEYCLETDEKGAVWIDYPEIHHVVCVKSKDNDDVMFDLTEDGYKLVTPVKSEKITVICQVKYRDMMDDDDKPRIPESVHPALADYICYRYLYSGNAAKQQRAQAWYQLFYTAMRRIRPVAMGSSAHTKNLYAASAINYRR